MYLKKDKNAFAIYQSIYRAPAFEARLGTSYLSGEKINFVNVGVHYWLDNNRSGLGLNLEQSVTKTTTLERWMNTEISYLHRLKAGLNLEDSSYYLSAQMRSSTIGTLGFSMPGIGIGAKQKLQSGFMLSMADWMDFSFKYYTGAKAQLSEIKSLIKLDFLLLNELGGTYFLEYGIGMQSYSTVNMGEFNATQIDLRVGLAYLF